MIENNEIKFDQLKSNLQQNPDSLIFARVAEALLGRGKVDEAIRICEEGIRKHPYYVTGHMVLGKCYLQKKMFDLAEKEFKRVLLFEPKHIAAHKFTGDLMKEAGWAEACQKSYAEILKIDPLDSKVSAALENIKREVASDQRVVSPAEGSIPKPVPEGPKEEKEIIAPDIKQFNESEQEVTVTTGPVQNQPIETTAINVDDDLFADDPPQIAQDKSRRNPEKADSSSVTSILDDIFEDSVEEKVEKPQSDQPKDDASREPDEGKPIDTIDENVLAGIQVKAYDPDAPEIEPEPEIPAEPSDSQPDETAINLTEDTIEFNKIDSLENAALENLKPVDEGEIEFISETEAQGDDFFDAMDAEFPETSPVAEPESAHEAPANENAEELPFKIENHGDDEISAPAAQNESAGVDEPMATAQSEQPETEKPEPAESQTPSEASAEQIFDEVFSENPVSEQETDDTPADLNALTTTAEASETADDEFDEILAAAEAAAPSQNAETTEIDIPALEDIPIADEPEIPEIALEDDQEMLNLDTNEVDSHPNEQEPEQNEPEAISEESASQPDDLDSVITAVDEASEKQTQELKTPEPPTPEPESQPHDSSAPEIDKDRIVTPTLGEIYAAQGQYAKAMSVFEVLSKKDPENKMYQEKVTFLKQRMSESSNA